MAFLELANVVTEAENILGKKETELFSGAVKKSVEYQVKIFKKWIM